MEPSVALKAVALKAVALKAMGVMVVALMTVKVGGILADILLKQYETVIYEELVVLRINKLRMIAIIPMLLLFQCYNIIPMVYVLVTLSYLQTL